MENILKGKKVVITGAARRIGREFALAVAREGANVIIHHSNSPEKALETANEIRDLGCTATIIKADFSDTSNTIAVFRELFEKENDIYALVNNAAIFKSINFANTTLNDWENHIDINLTVPFLISQLFSKKIGDENGRIINILDWRAARPGYDHFPYTISKAGLLSMTKSLALSLAPNIQVNGIALGAILPPSDGGINNKIIEPVPAQRWSTIKELTDTLIFLLEGPAYITGEILHLDGGRHLV